MRSLSWIALVLAGAVTISAHHSIAAVYDDGQRVTIDGRVLEFRFVNPHPFIVLGVERDGQAESWKLELDNRGELADAGVRNDTLKAGDRLIVNGRRARDGSKQLYADRIDRPADGWRYEQIGSSPRITRGR